MMAKQGTVALYVHLPWCLHKCPYCDFNSYALKDQLLPESRYIDALLADFDFAVAAVRDRTLSSIFIGGGTPSLFSAKAIGRLLESVARQLSWAADIEITMEANPGAVEHADFAEYRAAGINRLSLGIQSLNDTALRRLQRIHSAGEARAAVNAAQRVFDNINLDFMFALPGQTPQQLATELAEASSFATAHLSWYQLTLEANTALARRPPPDLPDDDTTAAMHETVVDYLGEQGYDNYEVSAFAQSGKQCRHNLNYWRFGDYLGIGAGAHGKVTLSDGGIERSARISQPQRYIEMCMKKSFALPLVETRMVSAAELGFEFMLNALRLKDGVSCSLFEETTGHSLQLIEAPWRAAIARGLMVDDPQRFVATPTGFRYLNETLQYFLP